MKSVAANMNLPLDLLMAIHGDRGTKREISVVQAYIESNAHTEQCKSSLVQYFRIPVLRIL